MNILIPDSWLREHLKTKATVKQISQYLSLCSQSVEKVIPAGNDSIYEIEITTNRSDCFSVYGIARELAAILPRFGISAELRPLSAISDQRSAIERELPLEVKITDPSLCPRFTALIFDQIVVKPSPLVVQERLNKSGIRSLNNVIDISNYLMLELGQPMHTFDYDKIKKAKMTLRQAQGKEKIITLDGQTRNLPPGAIIIEDGEGRIIDLCGIMGGANSAIDNKTKRVLLFVQTYQPAKIRSTCQKIAFRTEAASRFEKGVDPEGVIVAIKRAIKMFTDNAHGRVASNLIDIYPHPAGPKKINLTAKKLNQIMGIDFRLKEASQILRSLGFITEIKKQVLQAKPPHWRYEDINISEDLIEEISRLYGYHRLPSSLMKGEIPLFRPDSIFSQEEKIKDDLKFWDFTEIANYSLISLEWLQKINFNPKECLKLTNPLSEEWAYLRPTLIPSVLNSIKNNQSEKEEIRLFELAHVYLPKTKNKLPEEIPMLTVASNSDNFYQLKGILENLMLELNINDFRLEPYQLKKTVYGKIIHPYRAAEIMVKNKSLGVLAEINPLLKEAFGLKKRVTIIDLDLNQLSQIKTKIKTYTALFKYPAITEDLTFIIPAKTLVGRMIQSIKSVNSIIKSVELLDSFENTRTFRIAYQNPKKTLTDEEVAKVRGKIIKKITKIFNALFRASL